MLPQITLQGRAVDDPELRFTGAGDAVSNLRVVASERYKDKQTDEWKDGDKIFLSLSVWRNDAENLAEEVRKGDKVLVTGKLYEREYETRDGDKRKSIELKHATVALVPGGRPKADRDKARNGQPAAQRDNDPWAQPKDDPWARPQTEEPPF